MQSNRGVPGLRLRGLSEYTCWQHPFRECHIYMHPAQQARVQTQILSTFKSKDPSEVGGLLLGRIVPVGASMSIVIEDVEFVESSGKHFNSSTADFAKLDAALSGSPTRMGLSYVGYFRSHIREGLFLSAQDGELAERHMRDPDAIFLIIKPYDNGICMAGFFCWQNGSLEKEFSYLEAPFGSLEKRLADPADTDAEGFHQPDAETVSEQETLAVELPIAIAARELVSAPAAQTPGSHGDGPRHELIVPDLAKTTQERSMATALPTANPHERPVRPPAPEPSQKWRRLALQAVALLGIGLVAGYTSLLLLEKRFRVPTGGHVSQGIGLHVDRTPGGQLDVTWNRDLSAVGGVTGGKLSITDGAVRHELNLDLPQVRNGALAYFPSGGDVQFRLELFVDANHSISESIRTVIARSPAGMSAEPRVDNTVASGTAGRRLRPSKPPSLPKRNLALRQPAAAHANASDTRAATLTLPALSARRPAHRTTFELGLDTRRTAAPQTTVQSKPELLPAQLTRSEPPGTVFADFSARPASNVPPRVERLSTAAPPAAVATADYVGPAVIRKISPRIPMSVAGTITSEQIVQVTAEIDAEGKVKNARLTGSKGAISGLLGPAVLDALQYYRFRPASRGGVPVPSQSVISFKFKP